MQPGDLDGDDSSSNEEAAQVTTTTSTTVEAERGESGVDAGAPTATTPAPTATTAPPAGSGLGATTSPTGGTDGIAETGMESMLAPGLLLLTLGLAGRRLTAQS